MTKEARKEQLLDWINDIRSQRGLGPIPVLPQGNRKDHRGCVIARSFPGEIRVGTESMVIGGDGGSFDNYEHPDFVTAFVKDFDRREFPELLLT